MDKTPISVVVPVYRGAATLAELVARLAAVRERWNQSGGPIELVEAVFVDDGSRDGSADLLGRLAADHPWVKVVTLSRNFGQHPATAAGILHTSGDWVATLDEDLQHDPAGLLQLLRRAVVDGLDIVYARPQGRVHRSALRDLCSRWMKSAVSILVGTAQVQAFNSFRLVRGSIARAAASVSSHDSYLDVVLCWFSATYGTVPLPLHDARATTSGSGYTVAGLLSHARRLLVSSQTRWLRLGAGFGFLALAASAALFLIILLWKLIDPASIVVRGWSSLFLAITFFGGLGSFLLGVVLEYLSTLILHTQGKPTFFVVDRSGDDALRAYLSGGEADAAAAPPAGP